jgi:hypothetical protein
MSPKVCKEVSISFPAKTWRALLANSSTSRDALKRHENSHYTSLVVDGRREDHQGPGSSPSSRTAVACDRCARMKVRCDGKYPCGRCSKQELECTLRREHVALKRLCLDQSPRILHPEVEDSTSWSSGGDALAVLLTPNSALLPEYVSQSVSPC